MGFKKFSFLIVIRTVLAMATLVCLTILLTQPGYHAVSMILSALLISQLFELVRFVSKTNAELTRFFDAARHADYSQRFDLSRLGAGFDELGKAFGDILSRLQTARNQQEETLRHIKAVVEHVPVPLLSIQTNKHITLWNNSARRLFGAHHVVNLTDLSQFSAEFPTQLQALTPGERSLVTINIEGMKHQLSLSATEIFIAHQKEVLVSLQDIQSELDAAQLEAWQDLVRVLTHEIMNSITPVSSLAQTAVDLVDDVKVQVSSQPSIVESLDDVSDAVNTVARRSDSLMQFVSSYRRLTRLPPPNKRNITVTTLIEQTTKLTRQNLEDKGITVSTTVMPETLSIAADNDMIEQVLINLLKNAEQALINQPNPVIGIKAFLNPRGHVVIEIQDNGEGIADEVAEKVFVPFFTTKRDGSGVGLALTRQVMLSHGGYVSLRTQQGNGSTFSLIF